MGTIFVIAELFIFFLFFLIILRLLCCYLCRVDWVNKQYTSFK